ncbi:N-acetylgalactosaminyltransferase 7-like [Octopus sinensis]|uniref:N-acetylgalactosaminyltransferase 7-like n=1 Tax=Octopus sinensis TaxID=2607531 RepID=A0A6P7TYC0_9MOLL|nr:N-acetylgalactosaminyltransferase 7-like [Octopus sinensis]XP_036356020.1 N-acetylgalactosaminyltransferase 7-like [Octopus sinensis]XP_036356021.1 N-acetylgalactosaminyltransferase 7-like [Octopus sinensis]
MTFSRAIAVPVIDGIDWATFEYSSVYSSRDNPVGIFEWGFFYKEANLPLQKGKLSSEPYHSPTHAGGLLAIDRHFFKELGYYDQGLLVWGGEQYELSFKVWMCHGAVLWVPCSRIGHVYRGPGRSTASSKYTSQVPLSDLNHKRVVDTWFDEEHRKYFYRRHPELDGFSVDVRDQIALKNRLQCKSFSWFMKDVAPFLLDSYPYPHENIHFGNVCT